MHSSNREYRGRVVPKTVSMAWNGHSCGDDDDDDDDERMYFNVA